MIYNFEKGESELSHCVDIITWLNDVITVPANSKSSNLQALTGGSKILLCVHMRDQRLPKQTLDRDLAFR